MRRWGLVLMAVMAVGGGCARPVLLPVLPAVRTMAPAPGFATISVDELHALPVAQRPLLIDVREPDEYAAGHVPGAVNVPLATVAAWSAGQAPAVPLLVICHSGRRSAIACKTLVDKGFTRVTNIAGGTAEWINKGYPVERRR